MLNSTTLEVAIGMALIYLLLSLFCTAINEAIAAILGSRAKNLEMGLKSLFTDGLKAEAGKDADGKLTPEVSLADAIYAHGLVQSLYRSTAKELSSGWFSSIGSKLPSYIPARTFSSALLDILFAPGDPAPGGANLPAAPVALDFAAMLQRVRALPDSKGKQALLALVSQAGGDINKTRQAFENWFNDGMERVAGWYKRKTQLVLFLIGLTIAVTLNVDSISIGRSLWANPAFRSYAIKAAEQYAQDKTTPAAGAPKDLAALQSLALPLGWSTTKHPWMNTSPGVNPVFILAGWLLTAIAMTLGAPFWFDTLNKFMMARSAIKPQETGAAAPPKSS